VATQFNRTKQIITRLRIKYRWGSIGNMKTIRMLGLGSAVVGLVLLLFTFAMGYVVFQDYRGATPSSDLTSSMGTLLFAAVQALFLGIMGWVGSLLMLRGIDFEKVERGVGVVTFKVDKGVGIMTHQQEEAEKTS
jgi:hypothetical protein